ncbi:hypothetical protein [Methanoculleus formosensis]|nr:hypothetical protein [Methanoculleus sp. Afa-1]
MTRLIQHGISSRHWYIFCEGITVRRTWNHHYTVSVEWGRP